VAASLITRIRAVTPWPVNVAKAEQKQAGPHLTLVRVFQYCKQTFV
jgi:hypothetical protein